MKSFPLILFSRAPLPAVFAPPHMRSGTHSPSGSGTNRKSQCLVLVRHPMQLCRLRIARRFGSFLFCCSRGFPLFFLHPSTSTCRLINYLSGTGFLKPHSLIGCLPVAEEPAHPNIVDQNRASMHLTRHALHSTCEDRFGAFYQLWNESNPRLPDCGCSGLSFPCRPPCPAQFRRARRSERRCPRWPMCFRKVA